MAKLSDDLRYKLENVAVGMGVRNTDNYMWTISVTSAAELQKYVYHLEAENKELKSWLEPMEEETTHTSSACVMIGHTYRRSMNQEYPRKCLSCGHTEEPCWNCSGTGMAYRFEDCDVVEGYKMADKKPCLVCIGKKEDHNHE